MSISLQIIPFKFSKMLWIFFIISGVLGCLLFVKIRQRQTLLSKLAPIPGPPSLPFVGNALDFNVPKNELLSTFKRFKDKYGTRLKLFLGFRPLVVITNAADTETILSSQIQIEKSEDYYPLRNWLSLGLFLSGGKKWFQKRKQLTPAFHFKILEDFLQVFNEQCSVLQTVLERTAAENEAFDICPVITRCAFDIICETAFGVKVFIQQSSDSEYLKAVHRLSELVQYRQLRPWLHPDFLWKLSSVGRENGRYVKLVHDFSDLMIRERKEERMRIVEINKTDDQDEDYVSSKEMKKRKALLDLLLDGQEANPTLTDKNIREETDTFMFAGHDTTAAAASWITFLLSLHPEYQTKVHQEMDDIFGSDRSRPVTMADLAKMKYLECCIKEGLRIFPTVPIFARKLTKDQHLHDGVVLPQGVTVVCFIYFLHRDPKVFPNPEIFDPDRFKREEGGASTTRHAFAYVPFSAGPRNCIGQKFAIMEEKVMISTIFRNFKVNAAQRMEDVIVLCELVTRPEAGLYVTLQPR